MKTYCLFSGRHELPPNVGPIYESWDFDTLKGVKTPHYEELMKEGGDLIVTGLTPALTAFLSEFVKKYSDKKVKKSLYLLHYDSAKDMYWREKFFPL